MKHVKEIVLEKRNFKSYEKYIEIINKKFKSITFNDNPIRLNIEEPMTRIYEEFGSINLYIKTWGWCKCRIF